uniref:Uncharacterized protein n=1 Tax=Timema genevievae TaxID=629358 RepID=A0A7R9K9R1_TIMGE|nr:unnamed protein product [Timema genevievae]
MKGLMLTVCLAVLLGVVWGVPSPAGEKYTNKYDHLDIDAILSNERALNVYVKCILDQGQCPPEGKELKAHIPDAVKTSCKKCTDSQKKFLRKSSRFMIEKHPAEWKQILDHFDKDGTYVDSFTKFIMADD